MASLRVLAPLAAATCLADSLLLATPVAPDHLAWVLWVVSAVVA